MSFKNTWPDGPSQVALFAYDNHPFTEGKSSAAASDVRISTPGKVTRLKNLVTREIIGGKLPPPRAWNWQNVTVEDRVAFGVQPPPRSYAVCAPEGAREAASASAN